jgi:hypothetical protein
LEERFAFFLVDGGPTEQYADEREEKEGVVEGDYSVTLYWEGEGNLRDSKEFKYSKI